MADRERLRLARQFIDDCYDQPIDLALLARRAELSRFHFLRAFREDCAGNWFSLTEHRPDPTGS